MCPLENPYSLHLSGFKWESKTKKTKKQRNQKNIEKKNKKQKNKKNNIYKLFGGGP